MKEIERIGANGVQERLESWKDIGAYLQRDARTVRRWEREEGLPVHRHSHKSRSTVYAYPGEIDAWRASRRMATEPVRSLWRIPAFALTMLLCLVMVGNGVRPAAAAGQPGRQSARQVWIGEDVETSGAVSADGRYLSFIDWSTGDLAIRDLRTGKSRRITDKGPWGKSGDYAEASVFSADSSEIAYAWFVEGKEAHYELRVMSLNGSPSKVPRVLLRSQGRRDETEPLGWTPDGRQLLVRRSTLDGADELGMVDLREGSFRAIKTSRRINFPKLSPDGRWVAYGGLPDQDTQVHDVYVLATDGSQDIDVVPHAANDNPLAWSPDGSQLYFMSTRTGNISLWGIRMQGGRPAGTPEPVRPDTGPIQSLGMTRNGALYYSTRGGGGNNIYTAEIGPNGTVSKPPALLNERFVNSTQGAAISPNGKSLAYYSVRSGPEHLVIVRSIETGRERDFRQDFRLFVPNGSGPMWFPDSRSLLIMSCDLQKLPVCGFYRLDVESGEKELVLDSPRSTYKLSPDGKALFRIMPTQTAERLTRYDLETRRETELIADRWIWEIAVSPDSRQLAYLTDVESGAAPYTRSIYVMPATGGAPREIYRGTDLNHRTNALEWTPDGKSLLFVKGNGALPDSLWRVTIAGGALESTGLQQAGLIHGPQMHPDGKRLFYTMTDPNVNEVWALENFIPGKERK